MSSRVLLFDGEDISGYVGMWQESAGARINAVTVPRRHGALVSDAVVQDVRQIRISGTLTTDDGTAEGLRTILDTLNELFSRLGKRLQLWDDRYIVAYKASFTWKYIEGSGLTAADYTIAFSCPDPFVYSTLTDDVITTLNAMTTIDYTNHIYSQQWLLSNSGSVVAYPTYIIIANGNNIINLVLRNVTLGRQFTYTGTIEAGNELVVNTSEFAITNNGVEDLTNWSGDFIWLNAGSNIFVATATFAGVPSASNIVEAVWVHRYY